MNLKIKRAFLIVGISIVWISFLLFFYFSFRNFLGDVYVGRDCKYCNIDNVESRVRINIPQINDGIECIYNAEDDSKTVYFSVMLKKINLETYIKTNNLKLLEKSNQIDISHFLKLTIRPNIDIENFDNYYYKIQDGEQESSTVLFDKSTGDLWIYLKYKDTIPDRYVIHSHSYKSF
jgi:hypothetical protein